MGRKIDLIFPRNDFQLFQQPNILPSEEADVRTSIEERFSRVDLN
jgi:hypothetical protein